MVRDIQRETARHHRLPVEAMWEPRGRPGASSREQAWPRQEAMYLASLQGQSLSHIGRLFGGRDHTTVRSAIAMVKQRLAKDSGLQARLEDIIKRASEEQSPGQTIRGLWSPEEIAILRSVYPKRGSAGVRTSLPHRSAQSVVSKAKKLGVTFERELLQMPVFPTHCRNPQCGKKLCYSHSSRYLKRQPTGLCRSCCNRRPRSEELRRKTAEATRRAFQQKPEYRIKLRESLRLAMARLSPEERQARRERGRICGLSNRGNNANPAGSPCRLKAGKAAAETRRRKIEATRLAEAKRPKTFEEKLQLVAEGRARIVVMPTIARADPEYTLGGVSADWF